MRSDKQQAFVRSLRAEASVRAYSNVLDWLARLPIADVIEKIREKHAEAGADLPKPPDPATLPVWRPTP